MQEQIYIIGDVHGCYNTLLALLKQLPKNAKLCFVGDLCDRGKYSKEVIEFVKSNNYDCVQGNHETYFIELIETKPRLEWIRNIRLWIKYNGGKETLDSYRDENGKLDKRLMLEHIQWLSMLPLYKEYKNIKTKDGRYLVISHSHVYDKWDNRHCDEDTKGYRVFKETVHYSRYKDFDNPEIFNVFGHTPTENPIINEYKASIDLGCVYDEKNEGKLCVLEYPSMKLVIQKNVEVKFYLNNKTKV